MDKLLTAWWKAIKIRMKMIRKYNISHLEGLKNGDVSHWVVDDNILQFGISVKKNICVALKLLKIKSPMNTIGSTFTEKNGDSNIFK